MDEFIVAAPGIATIAASIAAIIVTKFLAYKRGDNKLDHDSLEAPETTNDAELEAAFREAIERALKDHSTAETIDKVSSSGYGNLRPLEEAHRALIELDPALSRVAIPASVADQPQSQTRLWLTFLEVQRAKFRERARSFTEKET